MVDGLGREIGGGRRTTHQEHTMAATATEEQVHTAPARMEVEDGVAVIRLDQPGKPVNVINRELLESMTAILARLEAREGGARAAVIVSEKKGTWIAGADIEQFRDFRTPADGEAASRAGHDLLRRLEKLPMPVVAAIDGVALGGGLEVALACTYRVASDGPKTKLGLPEVQLGILPGAGGTQRLPRLIGVRAALDLMLTGKQLDGRRAKAAGLVDEVVPAAILLAVGKRIALELADGTREPKRAARTGSPQAMERVPGMLGIIFRKARDGVMGKTHGLYPAPLRILQVVQEGLSRPLDQALDLEAKAFGELAVTPEARSLVHLFFTTTAAKNDPGLPEGTQARRVEEVAIVGAGFMGARIAAVSAEAGIEVRLKDVKLEAAAKGLRTARDILVKRAKRRKARKFEITRVIDRVQPTVEYTGFRPADVVVEAVFEDVDLKHRVIRDVEAVIGAGTVLGSNTSTIPITTLAEASSRPENVIGLHFFSPVEKMPLLEIIVTERTAAWVTATSHGYAKQIGKTPIIVNDSPGFYANRILSPYMAEAALLLEEGARIEDIDGAMTAWGYPVGPITLYDEVGLDVAQKSGKILTAAFAGRMKPSDVIDRLAADGRAGRKNGRGFYLYGEDGKKTGPDESVYPLIGSPPRGSHTRGEIQERLALTMVNEAVRTLEEGVLRSARDGDVGAVMGIGFPPFRGGPFWYVDQEGAANVLARLRALEERHGPRFAPAPLLVERARTGEKFSEDAA
jgi:3-hydroxyacyl-CoA dehydrogenase/enoyl-CoA hydratase/3-hydroxybutyryl-CoA epimerase